MDEWEQEVDERGGGEEGMDESEDGPEPPAALVNGGKDRVVDEREDEAGEEVKGVAERFRAEPVGCEGGAEQEGEVHACEPQLARRSQDGGQDDRAGEATGDRAPDAHRSASAIAPAALISAR